MGKYGDQWWTINGQEMFDMMKRCADGDITPELAYIELLANSEVDPATLPTDDSGDSSG